MEKNSKPTNLEDEMENIRAISKSDAGRQMLARRKFDEPRPHPRQAYLDEMRTLKRRFDDLYDMYGNGA